MICRNFINLELFVTSGHSTRRRNKCPQPTRENYRLKYHHRLADAMLGGMKCLALRVTMPAGAGPRRDLQFRLRIKDISVFLRPGGVRLCSTRSRRNIPR
jgi:hypothetical protein